ncbi:MAG: hypothetical protein C0631_10095 [Sedimenticola sp.]|nr:MAG: hypothetical protein C0631_10095 [Sedimenticola sp.]
MQNPLGAGPYASTWTIVVEGCQNVPKRLPEVVIQRSQPTERDTLQEQMRETKQAVFREQLKAGIDQLLDRDEGIAIESKATLDNLFNSIKI